MKKVIYKYKILWVSILLINLLSFWTYNDWVSQKGLHVDFLYCGQGDCTVVKHRGMVMVIDGGDDMGGAKGSPYIESYCQKMGVRKIDLMILSHGHADHLYGLVELIKKMPVSLIIEPGIAHNTLLYEEFLHLVESKGIQRILARRGWEVIFGDCKLNFIWPPRKCSDRGDLNHLSLVFRLLYKSHNLLFTGDLDKEGEAFLVGIEGNKLKSQILKVGHHGANTSSSTVFLEKCRPKLSIISCGKNNPFDFPRPETVRRLERWSKKVISLDKEGDFSLYFN